MDYSASASVRGGSGWTPAELGGWWFFAHPSRIVFDINSDVADWNSFGLDGKLTAPVSGNPTFVPGGWSGNPTLQFDGATDLLSQASGTIIDRMAGTSRPFSCLLTMQATTILTINAGLVTWDDTTPGSSASILRTDNVGSGRLRYVRTDSTGTTKDVTGTVNVGSGHVRVALSCTGTSVTTYVNGALDINASDVTTGSLTLNRIRLGNGPGALNALEGFVPEMVVVPTSISASDVDRYQRYSLARWGA